MLVHEYLRLFVFRRRMVTYEYFMDEMQDWEISMLADSLSSAYREEWEMTRWMVYSIVQPHLKKGMRDKPMKDVLPLAFDDDYEEERQIEITNAQVEYLKKRSEALEQRFKKNRTSQQNGSKQS